MLKITHTLPPTVRVTDPRGNVSYLSVVYDGSRVYFTEGWKKLGRLYGLLESGWIRFACVAQGNFDITVYNHLGHQVYYPLIGRPMYVGEKDHPILIPADAPALMCVDESKFVEFHTKKLTFEEVIGTKLVILIYICTSFFSNLYFII